MFKKLIEKHKQKQLDKTLDKPVFTLGDLCVGEIVLFKKSEYIGFLTDRHYYRIAKKLAFLYETEYKKYRHIVSNQDLFEMGSYHSIIGDYAVHNVRKFQDTFPIFMRKHNFTPDTKVSLRFIIENEDKLNKELDENQEKNELFEYPFDIT